eukprot:8599957-Prorocentrum_lima.AAC.1
MMIRAVMTIAVLMNRRRMNQMLMKHLGIIRDIGHPAAVKVLVRQLNQLIADVGMSIAVG